MNSVTAAKEVRTIGGMPVMSVPPRSQQTRPATLGQLPPIRRGDGTPIQVLLVDDERALTNLVTMALRYEGWGVEVAHNGRDDRLTDVAGRVIRSVLA